MPERGGQQPAGHRQQCAQPGQQEHRGVERAHADHHGRQGHDVEHDHLFPCRGARGSLPQLGAEDEGERRGRQRGRGDQAQPQPAEAVGQSPDVGRDYRQHRGAQRGHGRPGEPQAEPPRTVGPQHAQQQPDVARRHPGDQQDALVSRIDPVADLPHPPHHRGRRDRTFHPTRLVHGERGDIAQQRGDQPHEGLQDPAADGDRAERGQRQHGHPVNGAGVRHHRAARRRDGQVGDDDGEVPASRQHAAARHLDQFRDADGRRQQPVGIGADRPPHSGQPGPEPLLDLGRQVAHQIPHGTRRGDHPDDHLSITAVLTRLLRF